MKGTWDGGFRVHLSSLKQCGAAASRNPAVSARWRWKGLEDPVRGGISAGPRGCAWHRAESAFVAGEDEGIPGRLPKPPRSPASLSSGESPWFF